jgi:hypothetical protein
LSHKSEKTCETGQQTRFKEMFFGFDRLFFGLSSEAETVSLIGGGELLPRIVYVELRGLLTDLGLIKLS